MVLLSRAYNFPLIFLMCAIWAGNYFAIKDSNLYLNPVLFALFRSIGAGVILVLAGRSELRKMNRSDVGFLALIGLFQVTIFYVTLNVGLQTVSTSVASTLVYTQPVLVVAFSPLIGERLTIYKTAGIAIAFIGVATIFLPDLEKSGVVVGDALELIASLSWMISVLIYKKWKHSLNHYIIPGMQNVLGALFIIPFLAFEPIYLSPSASLWFDLVYVIVLGSGIAYVIYFRALSRMQASVFSSYLFLVPTLNTIYQSVITLTIPSIYQIAGTIMVCIGIVTVNRNFMEAART